MLIGTHQQLSKVRTDSLLVAGTVVSSVNEARNLGVWFDSKFQFQTHINKTCQSAFYYIYNIRRIRKLLSFETLVQALVIRRVKDLEADISSVSPSSERMNRALLKRVVFK